MKIKIVEVAKISSGTKGPSSGPWAEIKGDGVHCNMNVPGVWYPQPRLPLMAWECLISG